VSSMILNMIKGSGHGRFTIARHITGGSVTVPVGELIGVAPHVRVRSKKPKLQSKEFYFQPLRCMIPQQFSPTVLWNLVLEVAECPVSLRQFRDNSQST
jgi:hypothetical protein